MKTVIMAGGRGSRIQSVASDIPKPMIPIGGKPILEHELLSLKEQGFTDILITVSHMGSLIMDHFGDGSRLGLHIEYYNETTPLGNAGALFRLRQTLGTEPFLLLNADTMFDVDFRRMVRFHKEHGGLVTLFTHPNSHPYDSGLLITAADGSVDAWLSKEDPRPEYYKNRVNAGVHILDPKLLDQADIDPERIGTTDPDTGKTVKVDLDRQLLKPLAATGTMFCYDSPEYVRDMGTPDRFRAVERDLLSGRVRASSLRCPQKAIFLDRDGTINEKVDFLNDPDQFRLTEGTAEAIRAINDSGYLCIVITNQPVIARGELTVEGLERIHNKMETLLGLEGAYVNAIYYCPHHPDRGFPGEIPELKTECLCRKPKPGLLLKAAEDFNIDLSASWMVGDSAKNDVGAGRAAGCRTALIGSGDADVNVASIADFVRRYLLPELKTRPE